jgi:hypothetical protein
MTRVDDAAWVAKAMTRKAFRDQARDKFWAEVGMKKGAHVQDVSGAPQERIGDMLALLSLTASGSLINGSHKAMIGIAQAALATAGLGTGAMGCQAANLQKLDDFGMVELRKSWFVSPAFFD